MSEWSATRIRELERDSIRAFVASYPFHGDVLDYGCGKMPYQTVVLGAAVGNAVRYVPWDRATLPANVSDGDVGADDVLHGRQWDAILCTQVVQYVPDVYRLLRRFRDALKPGGALVLTGPGCWAEVEPDDLHRFTRAGIGRLLTAAGFEVERLEERAAVDLGGFRFSLGWGAVGRV